MQVFLIQNRTDIPAGVLQIVDLWPNTSQRNMVLTPPGQTGYLKPIIGTFPVLSVSAGPPVVASAAIEGVAAYLIGNIDSTAAPGSAVFTAAQANTATTNLIALVVAGTPLTLANVNGVLGAVVAGTTLTAGGSTGVLTELLSILAGNVYVIPAGTAISDGAGLFAGRVGGFVAGQYRQLYSTDFFIISNAEGAISQYKNPGYTYAGVSGAALRVFDETGSDM